MKRALRFLSFCSLLLVSLLILVSCGTKDPSGDVFYTVGFDVCGTVTEVSVKAGETPAFPGTPEKSSDGEHSYVFSGWDREIVPASADAVYTAQFTVCEREELTVKWYLDGQMLSTTVIRGDVPTEPDFERTVETDSYTKTFRGWDKELAPVTENNTVYRAQYDTVYKTATVTFKNGETVLLEKQVRYGERPVYEGDVPQKTGLTFFGFTNTEKEVNGPTVCEAQFCKLDPVQLKTAIRDFGPLAFGSTKDGENTGNANNSGAALLYLATDAFLSGEKNEISERCAEHLRSLIAGGHEPAFTAGPFWAYAYVSGGILMCKNTPAVWDLLTDAEKEKLDMVMACFAVSSAFVTDDDNTYRTGPALTGNFYKTWNPNHRMANIEPIIYASLYFGGADAVNAILLNFDHDTYIAKFEEYGFVNAKHNWTMESFLLDDGVTVAPGSKELMMNGGTAYYKFDVSQTGNKKGEAAGSGVGVKTEYTYNGCTLDELGKIYEKLAVHNYSGGKVFSRYMKDGSAICYILGDLTSPMEGEDGMMYEFVSSDGEGIRSSASYCLEDFVLAFSCGQVLKNLGVYDPESNTSLFRKIYVGNTDFIYKIDNGYHGYSRGGSYDTKASNSICYYAWRSLWLSEYGDMTLEDFEAPGRDYDFESSQPTVSANGINSTPGGEFAEVRTSEHAHNGSKVLHVRVQETWGRIRFTDYFTPQDIGKTFKISFFYYLESELVGEGPFSFFVKVDTKDCQQTGGYSSLTVPVTESGRWISVDFTVTYTQQMADAGANCLVFAFPKLGQVHAQRDENYNYVLDGGNLIGVKFADILLDDVTIAEAQPERSNKVFELDFEKYSSLPASDGEIGGYGKSTQQFGLGGDSTNRYFFTTIKDPTKDMGYQFFAKNANLVPAEYTARVEKSAGQTAVVLDGMKYTFDFAVSTPAADTMPNMTFTIYNQDNGGGLKLITFSGVTAKTNKGTAIATITPGEFTRFTVSTDLTDKSNVLVKYYVNGELKAEETISSSSYAEAFLGLLQFKFYIGTNSAVDKTVWIDNVILYNDVIVPEE